MDATIALLSFALSATFDIDTRCTLPDAAANIRGQDQSGSTACPPGDTHNTIDLGGATVVLDAPIRFDRAHTTLRDGTLSGGKRTALVVVEGDASLETANVRFVDALGAIRVRDEGRLRVLHSAFADHRADRGAAIDVDVDASITVEIHNSSFDRNVATTEGGAVACRGAALAIVETEWIDNAVDAATNGRGGAISTACPLDLSIAGFAGNRVASGAGGAIAASSDLTLRDVAFLDGSAGALEAVDGAGGAIALSFGTLDLERAGFFGNRSMREGGAIALDATVASARIASATFDRNVAYSADEHEPMRGAAVAVLGATTRLELLASTVATNLGRESLYFEGMPTRYENNLVLAELVPGCGGAPFTATASSIAPSSGCGSSVHDPALSDTAFGGWFAQPYRLARSPPRGAPATCAELGVDQLGTPRATCMQGATIAPQTPARPHVYR